MNIENNNFLLGVVKKNKKKQNNKNSSNVNNVFIQELIKIQNSIRQESNNVKPIMNNTSKNIKLNMMINKEEKINEKKSFKNILLGIIKKLEDDVEIVSRQIHQYNEEKKSILEMDKKEILKLKSLTKKLYQTIMKIYMSLDVDKNVRIELLEKLKKDIESNKILLKNINEIDNIKPVENILNQQKFNQNINKNINKNKNNLNKEEIKNQQNQEIENLEEPSNVTIFNIINENKKSKNNNNQSIQVENKEEIESSLNETNANIQTNETVVNNSLQTTTLNQQIKEKKINTSKKVSKKLNELFVNNGQAKTLLNNFLVETIGTSKVNNELSSNSTNNRSNSINSNKNKNNKNNKNNNNYQTTPMASSNRNNVFI